MSRMTTTTTPLAVAADYADALLTARTARRWLFGFLVLFLLAQMAVFLLARFSILKFGDADAPTTLTISTPPASQPAGTAPDSKTATVNVAELIRYVTPAIDFLAVALSLILLIVLLLLVTIMLVGRLVGVSHVTS